MVAVGAILVLGGSFAGLPDALPAAPPESSAALKITPASPVQGDTLTAMISAPISAEVNLHFDRTLVPTFPLSHDLRRGLIGTDPDVAAGSHTIAVVVIEAGHPPLRASHVVRIQPGHFGVRTLTLPPGTFNLITPENLAIERRALAPVLGRRTPVVLWSGAFQAPSTGTMDSPYGMQGVYNGHREWWHGGMDYSAPAGSPVVAANAGVVVLARALPLGGNTIVIDHGQGVLTEYLHLLSFAVHPGVRVERGALIGGIGATGLVTGPSLHWGLYVNGIPVNPLFWMEPRPGLTLSSFYRPSGGT